jgi:hypothetical protein
MKTWESSKTAMVAWCLVVAPMSVGLMYCGPQRVEPVTPPPSFDAGADALPPEDGGTACARACLRRQRLGCPTNPVLPPEECEKACAGVEARVPGLLRTWCTSNANSCDEYTACSNR